MTAADREAAARRQRAQETALWRWTLVEPAMDPALTARQRGHIVRELASREHEGPDGKTRTGVSRRTLDRWIVARRDSGFEALVPDPRQCPPQRQSTCPSGLTARSSTALAWLNTAFSALPHPHPRMRPAAAAGGLVNQDLNDLPGSGAAIASSARADGGMVTALSAACG